MNAARYGKLGIVKWLYGKKADVEAKSKVSCTVCACVCVCVCDMTIVSMWNLWFYMSIFVGFYNQFEHMWFAEIFVWVKVYLLVIGWVIGCGVLHFLLLFGDICMCEWSQCYMYSTHTYNHLIIFFSSLFIRAFICGQTSVICEILYTTTLVFLC